MRRVARRWLCSERSYCVAAISPLAQRGPTAPVWPGYKGEGVTLLPNGWRIAPEGRHVTVGDLPMNLVPSPDGRFLAISTSGYAKPAISIFDTQVACRSSAASKSITPGWASSGTRTASGCSRRARARTSSTNSPSRPAV